MPRPVKHTTNNTKSPGFAPARNDPPPYALYELSARRRYDPAPANSFLAPPGSFHPAICTAPARDMIRTEDPRGKISAPRAETLAGIVYKQYPLGCTLLVVAMAVAVAVDPLRLGPLGNHDYRPVKHTVAPYKQVMSKWPADTQSKLRFGKLEFADQIYGPESLEFDLQGRGPYAGLADGRIVRWMGPRLGWETFALLSPNWSEGVCANGIDSTTSKQCEYEEKCGRPLGLRFDKITGDLFVADAYHGLLVVGPAGGTATPLATHAEGKRILFANDLDIHSNGSVFFTDTSMRYDRKDHFLIMLEGEGTGRLLRYDPGTKTTAVVLRGLVFPNGVQLSHDQSFLLFAETTNCRIMRYWLDGPKVGRVEVFADLAGYPDNVRRNGRGQFWVAIDCCRTPVQEVLSSNPWMRRLYFRLPLKLEHLARWIGMKMYTVITLFDENGDILEVLEDRKGEVVKLVSEVHEFGGKLWIGTVVHNHIATLPYPFPTNLSTNSLQAHSS